MKDMKMNRWLRWLAAIGVVAALGAAGCAVDPESDADLDQEVLAEAQDGLMPDDDVDDDGDVADDQLPDEVGDEDPGGTEADPPPIPWMPLPVSNTPPGNPDPQAHSAMNSTPSGKKD